MNSTVTIRLATPEDAAEILKMYAPYVVNTAISLSMKYRRKKNSGEESKAPSNAIRISWLNRKDISSAMLMYRFFMRERLMIGLWKRRFMWTKTTNAAAAEAFISGT